MTKDLELRIRTIEQRNSRVEDDKAWETSRIRKLIILLLTFVFIGLYLSWLKVNKPWQNAVVPSLGYFLSTLFMGSVKTYWLKLRK